MEPLREVVRRFAHELLVACGDAPEGIGAGKRPIPDVVRSFKGTLPATATAAQPVTVQGARSLNVWWTQTVAGQFCEIFLALPPNGDNSSSVASLAPGGRYQLPHGCQEIWVRASDANTGAALNVQCYRDHGAGVIHPGNWATLSAVISDGGGSVTVDDGGVDLSTDAAPKNVTQAKVTVPTATPTTILSGIPANANTTACLVTIARHTAADVAEVWSANDTLTATQTIDGVVHTIGSTTTAASSGIFAADGATGGNLSTGRTTYQVRLFRPMHSSAITFTMNQTTGVSKKYASLVTEANF